MKAKKLSVFLITVILAMAFCFTMLFYYAVSGFRKESRMNIPYETEEFREKFRLLENEDEIVRRVFSSTRGLPSWATDINAELSLPETIRLLYYVHYSETDPRRLLPQVRRNAKKYHIPVPGDKETAEYVESRLNEAFSIG